MVQGAYLCPDLPGHICHGDGTPIRPGASGTKTAADVPPGVPRHPVARLICGRASSAASGMPGAGLPRMQALPSDTESTGTRWPAPRLGRASWPTRRRIWRAKLVHKSAFRRLQPSRVRRHTAGTGRRSAGPAGPCRLGGLIGRPGAGASIGERAGGDEVADRVVIGDLAQLAAANMEHTGAPADAGPTRRGRSRIASRSALSSRSCRTRLVSDEAAASRADSTVISARRFPAHGPAFVARTASSFWRTESARLPGKSAKRAESPLTFCVVIESNRTQASRTMNAAPAQAGADRVD